MAAGRGSTRVALAALCVRRRSPMIPLRLGAEAKSPAPHRLRPPGRVDVLPDLVRRGAAEGAARELAAHPLVHGDGAPQHLLRLRHVVGPLDPGARFLPVHRVRPLPGRRGVQHRPVVAKERPEEVVDALGRVGPRLQPSRAIGHTERWHLGLVCVRHLGLVAVDRLRRRLLERLREVAEPIQLLLQRLDGVKRRAAAVEQLPHLRSLPPLLRALLIDQLALLLQQPHHRR
mmetsp:Transcript_59594/g.143103  ORF Transcript_59594/g.143103 Transcript_59594/m.143103 type:complete len:231 (-) Transcript_59594:388-1080(-)